MDQAFPNLQTRLELIVPIFLERFVLTVLATLMVAIMTLNPLHWDLMQQVGAVVVLVGLALFCAGTAHRMNRPLLEPAAASQERRSGPASSTGDQSPANTGDGNTFKYDGAAPAPKRPPKAAK
jgi:hypothetical protein